MTPTAVVRRVLDSIDGISVDADANETAAAILRAGIALCGIALMRIPDLHEREAQLFGIEADVRDYIERVLARARARSSPYPRVGNGHAA